MNLFGTLCLKKGNKPEALKWYLKAAEKGNEKAMYNAGKMYESNSDRWFDGSHEERKVGQMYWLRKSAELGYAPAKKELDSLSSKNM